MTTVGKQIISWVMILCFMVTSSVSYEGLVWAQSLPASVSSSVIGLSPTMNPVSLKGLTVNPHNPFEFDFLISDQYKENNASLETKSRELIQYFLAALTTPDDQIWVNLSPYESERIIADGFEQTTMGRDMLAQDYLLKQLTASLMFPETDIGAQFWDRIYQEAFERYGTTEILVDTFNKVWIVPDLAEVYEHNNTAYVMNKHLKVMLEKDYLAQEPSVAPGATLGSEVIRDIIIPQLEHEVNHGTHFAPLRQMYDALILSTWFKRRLADSVVGQVYVDQNKTNGVAPTEQDYKQRIYDEYTQLFKKGIFDYIKEERDEFTNEIIPRKYFAGGTAYDAAMVSIKNSRNLSEQDRVALSSEISNSTMMHVKTIFNQVGEAAQGKVSPIVFWETQSQKHDRFLKTTNDTLTTEATEQLEQVKNEIIAAFPSLLGPMRSNFRNTTIVVAENIGTYGSIFFQQEFFYNPVIVINAEFYRRLSSAQRLMLIGHELGHVLFAGLNMMLADGVVDSKYSYEIMNKIEDSADALGVYMTIRLMRETTEEELASFFDVTESVRDHVRSSKTEQEKRRDEKDRFDPHSPIEARKMKTRMNTNLATKNPRELESEILYGWVDEERIPNPYAYGYTDIRLQKKIKIVTEKEYIVKRTRRVFMPWKKWTDFFKSSSSKDESMSTQVVDPKSILDQRAFFNKEIKNNLSERVYDEEDVDQQGNDITWGEYEQQSMNLALELNDILHSQDSNQLNMIKDYRLRNALRTLRSLREDWPEEVTSLDDVIDYLFFNHNNRFQENIVRALASIRLFFDYRLGAKTSNLPPIAYAQKYGFRFEIAPGLYISPITESFRRHLVFKETPQGEIEYAFEVMVPGQAIHKTQMKPEWRAEIADDMLARLDNGDDVTVEVLDYRSLPFTTDIYTRYRDQSRFKAAKLAVIDYPHDGKRITNYSLEALKALAIQLGWTYEQLKLEIAKQVAQRMKAQYRLGYLGSNLNATDSRLENFRLEILENGINVRFVADFQGFRRTLTERLKGNWVAKIVPGGKTYKSLLGAYDRRIRKNEIENMMSSLRFILAMDWQPMNQIFVEQGLDSLNLDQDFTSIAEDKAMIAPAWRRQNLQKVKSTVNLNAGYHTDVETATAGLARFKTLMENFSEDQQLFIAQSGLSKVYAGVTAHMSFGLDSVYNIVNESYFEKLKIMIMSDPHLDIKIIDNTAHITNTDTLVRIVEAHPHAFPENASLEWIVGYTPRWFSEGSPAAMIRSGLLSGYAPSSVVGYIDYQSGSKLLKDHPVLSYLGDIFDVKALITDEEKQILKEYLNTYYPLVLSEEQFHALANRFAIRFIASNGFSDQDVAWSNGLQEIYEQAIDNNDLQDLIPVKNQIREREEGVREWIVSQQKEVRQQYQFQFRTMGINVDPNSPDSAMTIDPEIFGWKSHPESDFNVVVQYRSGFHARDRGNFSDIEKLFNDSNIVSIELGPGQLSMPKREAVAEVDQITNSWKEPLREKLATFVKPMSETDLSGMPVAHGTVRGYLGSVLQSPQNVGKGFGGAGLYLDISENQTIAEEYAGFAQQAVANRKSHLPEDFQDKKNSNEAIVMQGTLNFKDHIRVGQFDIAYDGPIDWENGVLPAMWADDPNLQQVMIEMFDVLDLRNMYSNGLNLRADRLLVVHESAGVDFIQWDKARRLATGESIALDDEAMATDVGGIDFNPENLNIRTTGDNAQMIQFNFTPEQIEQMKRDITGFTPVIINIQPVTNLPLLLGLEDVNTNTVIAQS